MPGLAVVEGPDMAGGGGRELQRNTLPIAWRKEVEEVGMWAGRSELARSLSTAALRR